MEILQRCVLATENVFLTVQMAKTTQEQDVIVKLGSTEHFVLMEWTQICFCTRQHCLMGLSESPSCSPKPMETARTQK